jgi:hypothetical protein
MSGGFPVQRTRDPLDVGRQVGGDLPADRQPFLERMASPVVPSVGPQGADPGQPRRPMNRLGQAAQPLRQLPDTCRVAVATDAAPTFAYDFHHVTAP